MEIIDDESTLLGKFGGDRNGSTMRKKHIKREKKKIDYNKTIVQIKLMIYFTLISSMGHISMFLFYYYALYHCVGLSTVFKFILQNIIIPYT